MKVSIITVCFNSAATIKDTINSVLSQTYDNIEYIIVDGYSKDATLSIIEPFRSQIDILVSEPDNGIYDAMNKGIGLATGDVIGILNSDDFFADDSIISSVAEYFKLYRECDAVYGDLVYFSGTNFDEVKRHWKSRPFDSAFFENGNVIPHPTLFVKKKVYDKVGVYYPNFKISSDYEFTMRAFYINDYKPQYLGKVFVKMRLGGESTRSFKNILIGSKEVFKSWRMNQKSPPLKFYWLRYFRKLLQYFT